MVPRRRGDLHYLPGQNSCRISIFWTRRPGYAKDVAEHGQRVLTFLLCLNDDYEGGRPIPVLGKRWKDRRAARSSE